MGGTELTPQEPYFPVVKTYLLCNHLNILYSWSSVSIGSASIESTNFKRKICRKKLHCCRYVLCNQTYVGCICTEHAQTFLGGGSLFPKQYSTTTTDTTFTLYYIL